MAIPCFFKHGSYAANVDETIDFFCHNWHRDVAGNDLLANGGLSIAEVFSTGLLICVPGVCREYFALAYWCERYDCVQVSCNEPDSFLNIAKNFSPRVQIYDPGHRQTSLLKSFSERVLRVPPLDWRLRILRQLQTPFLPTLRGRTLALNAWTLGEYARKNAWLTENSRFPWRSAYARRPSQICLDEAERLVPLNFDAEFSPRHLAAVLQRIDVRWEHALIELLSEKMTERYDLYRSYFVTMLAQYQDLLDSYCPGELVLTSEFYEPHLLAAQMARVRGIKVSWLVDGYPVVELTKRIGKAVVGPQKFDRIYAVANQHAMRLLRTAPATQELLTVFPPILLQHRVDGCAQKRFDAIVMTSVPFDMNLQGRNGSCPDSLIEALRVATDAGLQRLAVKIKHFTEKSWIVPVLEKAGYLRRVTLLEGPFSVHVGSAHRVIGGISSAVGEAAYHGIPYYVYEPVANGYSEEQINSTVVISKGGVARTPEELAELLKRPEGSVIADRNLLFGTEYVHGDWSWDKSRELYTDWAAQWADRSGIKEALQWRGFPLWWASNLIAKDTAVDYAWYQTLHERLQGQKNRRFQRRGSTSVYFGLLKGLVKDIGRWSLVRIFPAGSLPAKGGVWFHSLEYNLLDAREGFCDRMYEKACLDDHKHGFVSSFLVRLNIKRTDFFHPLLWRRRIAGLASRLCRDVEILDRHFRFFDMVGMYLSLMKNYFELGKLLKPMIRRGVYVGHAEFTDILVLELQKSFVSSIPWGLSYMAMFESWLDKIPGDQTLITYGETLAPIRPAYFAVRRHSAGHRCISIQHATIYKNKMGFYHRFSEFNHTGPDDRRCISPMPDYYFVHGTQFADILAEYYPSEKIRIIGCLKYDSLYRQYGSERPVPARRREDRMLLLAPSVGDEEIILRIFSGLKTLTGWRVMLSRHPTVSQEWIDELIRRNGIQLVIEIDLSRSTTQLIESASLVICSYSGMALESHFVGVPSVRVLNPAQPPMVEDEPGIKYVTTQQELLQVIAALSDREPAVGLTPEIEVTLERYFFEFDGQVSQRFWTQICELPDLPAKRTIESTGGNGRLAGLLQ